MAARKPRQKSQTGLILGLISQLRPGEYFYTDSPTNIAQIYSVKAGVKVQTISCLLIENHQTSEPITSKITKVTIL